MTGEPSPRRFYRFGEFRLDARTGELYRESLPVRLPPQPGKILLLLVEARGGVVTREEIQKAVWSGDTFVDFEDGINKAIKQIRTALGDAAEGPKYVETVSRRGYRVVTDVEIEGVQAKTAERERCPYPGLSAFTERDAASFFGREEEVESLWRKIESRCLLAVIGPSGAGKSSLLRAGLIPARGEGWGLALCQPRSSPFVSLADAIQSDRSANLGQALSEWRKQYTHALLVVDQFEELFTLSSAETQKEFAELLGAASDSGIHVLLSMRDDFLMRCNDYPALAPVFDKLTPLTALEGAALRRALVEPATRAGYRFEDEALVAEILTEVSRARGALPLLAFAASKLWEKRDREGRRLTREAYLSIGGVAGALAKHAEETLASIGADREPLVREVFRNLTTASGTRVPMDREELLSAFPDREEAAKVLGKLVDARLLTSAGREVEVTHESLLSAWPRLVRWQAQDAEGAVFRDQLLQAARAWADRARPEDLLWTGTVFQELTLWRKRYPGGLTATEQAFADASANLAGRRRRRRRIAMATLLAASIAVAAVTSSLWRNANAEARRAEASKLLALAELALREDPTEALALATASLEEADTEEARIFVMKALWEAPAAIEIAAGLDVRSPEFSPDGTWLATAGHGTDAFVWSEDGRGPLVLPGHQPSPRGSNRPHWASSDLLVTGPFSFVGDRVHLWSLPEGRLVRTIELGGPSYWQVGSMRLLAETVDGIGNNLGRGRLRSWALPDGEPQDLGRVDWEKLGAEMTFFEPDGRSWLYAKDSVLYSRTLPAGHGSDRAFAHLGGEVGNFWLTSDPEQLIVKDESGKTHVWSYSGSDPPQEKVITKPVTAPDEVLLDPSLRLMASNPAIDRRVRIWDLTSAPDSRPLSLRRKGVWYGALRAFHPTGDWLVASTSDYRRLTFWPLRRSYPEVVDGYTELKRPLAFSPDGKWIASGWGDLRLRLWPILESGIGEPRSLDIPDPEAASPIASIAFDPQGRHLFVAANQDRVSVVPLDGGSPRKLQGFSEDTLLNSSAISPSGRFAATAFYYGAGSKTLRVWDLETGALRVFDLPESEGSGSGFERGIAALSFATESTLYTLGDGGMRLWNLDTGRHELVAKAEPGVAMPGTVLGSRGVAITAEIPSGQIRECRQALVHDLKAGTSRELTKFGDCGAWSTDAVALDPTGTVAATGTVDGVVRVGSLSGGEPHLLVGHEGAIDRIAISPDLRWVATTGEDNTLRLWPMPDLSKPPLHTLPHDELLAKLRSLTNFRAVRDPASPTGWKVEVGPFPGWKNVPDW